jgi:hypothetical protein
MNIAFVSLRDFLALGDIFNAIFLSLEVKSGKYDKERLMILLNFTNMKKNKLIKYLEESEHGLCVYVN